MSKLKIAVQKSGRLSEKSLELLKSCGIKLQNGGRTLKSTSSNFPIEVLFLRDDDIPQYVEQGISDIGILGQNEVWEKQKEIDELKLLGFARCKLSLAIPKENSYTSIESLEGKRIATSYPVILSNYLQQQGINATIEEIGGSVEIAPGIGLADAIMDIVSTGSTLLMNGLKEVEVIAKSEAVLIANRQISADKSKLLNQLLFRMDAVQQSKENKYILLNAPNDQLEKITQILPGMKSPTILPLAEKGWSSLHSVIREDDFWNSIDQLKNAGAEGILVVPIEKLIL